MWSTAANIKVAALSEALLAAANAGRIDTVLRQMGQLGRHQEQQVSQQRKTSLAG
jgi:hypothetical protein